MSPIASEWHRDVIRRYLTSQFGWIPQKQELDQGLSLFLKIITNPFVPNAPFLYLLKISENRKVFSDVFRG